MKDLRVPAHKRSYHWSSFRLGLFVGVFGCACAVAVVAIAKVDIDAVFTPWEPAWRMYRGMLLPLLLTMIGEASARGVSRTALLARPRAAHRRAPQWR